MEDFAVVERSFAERSRTSLSILEVSGLTGELGVAFGGGGSGLEAIGFGDVEEDCGSGLDDVFGGTEAFLTGFTAAAGEVVTGSFPFTALGTALVDFGRAVVFLGASISGSTESEATFFDLPFFFTASADILADQVWRRRRELNEESQSGNLEDLEKFSKARRAMLDASSEVPPRARSFGQNNSNQ